MEEEELAVEEQPVEEEEFRYMYNTEAWRRTCLKKEELVNLTKFG